MCTLGRPESVPRRRRRRRRRGQFIRPSRIKYTLRGYIFRVFIYCSLFPPSLCPSIRLSVPQSVSSCPRPRSPVVFISLYISGLSLLRAHTGVEIDNSLGAATPTDISVTLSRLTSAPPHAVKSLSVFFLLLLLLLLLLSFLLVIILLFFRVGCAPRYAV